MSWCAAPLDISLEYLPRGLVPLETWLWSVGPLVALLVLCGVSTPVSLKLVVVAMSLVLRKRT